MGATELYPVSQRIYIPWWHRILGQLWSYEGYDYKKLFELPEGHRGRRRIRGLAEAETSSEIRA
ncbi:hypothetical protein CCGE525_34245 (plasmid) [Rhizobium jaguaris]|uniref:Uncharacterized protein n=2 Tax=Rhizobium jaguaris TaxID=1312183 RepID=A0A387G272_9HYPH|nr:hypothetical protein CCGE525_34245 [Rhizobium jaguaris]